MQASLILVSGLSPKRDILSMLNLTNESPDKPEVELLMNFCCAESVPLTGLRYAGSSRQCANND